MVLKNMLLWRLMPLQMVLLWTQTLVHWALLLWKQILVLSKLMVVQLTKMLQKMLLLK